MVPTFERVTNLLALLLERRQSFTQDQIVHELAGQYPEGLAAQRGAFERDKALLRDIGVPLETEVLGGDRAGETAYWIDRSKYELRGLELDDDERRALQWAVAAIRSEFGQQAVWKLGGAAMPRATLVANLPQLAVLPDLRAACAQRSTVSFEYHERQRLIDPYSLMLREGYWYLIGRDHGHDEVRTFRADRIVGAVTTLDDASFERPEGFDPRTEFPDDPRRLGEADEARLAVVLIDEALARVVRQDLGDDAVVETRGDGRVVFAVPCSNVSAFRSWVLAFGEGAEVIGPPEVRADLIEWLRRTAGLAAVAAL